jgi:hypothetical protein
MIMTLCSDKFLLEVRKNFNSNKNYHLFEVLRIKYQFYEFTSFISFSRDLVLVGLYIFHKKVILCFRRKTRSGYWEMFI